VVATDLGGGGATGSFVVSALAISVSPGRGPPGSTFAVLGSGFSVQSAVNVSFAGNDLGPSGCSIGLFAGTLITTNSTGAYACDFEVPVGAPGVYSVLSGDSATANESNSVAFTIPAPSVVPLPGTGSVGNALTVSGGNFTVSSFTNVTFGGELLVPSSCSEGTFHGAAITLTATGAFSCAYLVPALPAGAQTITATEGKTDYNATFTIVPRIVVTPTDGKVGAQIAFAGLGFDANARYVVSWNSSFTLCSGNTNASGQFNCTFAVPASSGGSNTISVSEGAFSGSQALTFSFTVTATPSPRSGSSPFPWWEVGVGAAAVVLILITVLYVFRRSRGSRHPASHPGRSGGGVQPYVGPSPGVGAGATSSASPASLGGPALGATADAQLEPEPDIDVLIAQLERMSVHMFKKTPKELAAQSSTEEISEPTGEQ